MNTRKTKAPATTTRRGGPSGTHANKGVLIRAPEEEQQAWQRAAEAAGLTRTEWIRAALRRASARVR